MKPKYFIFLFLFSLFSIFAFSALPEDDVGKDKTTVCLNDDVSHVEALLLDMTADIKTHLDKASASNDADNYDFIIVHRYDHAISSKAIIYEKPFVKYQNNTF